MLSTRQTAARRGGTIVVTVMMTLSIVTALTHGSLAALAAPQEDKAAAVCRPVDSGSVRLSDYNADGWPDLAVGDPDATVDGRARAGRVVVLLGDSDGRIGEGRREVITQKTVGLSVEAGDRFGAALATSELDNVLGSDLVIGSPGEDVGTSRDTGAFTVMFGSRSGLGRGVNSTLTMDWGHFGTKRQNGDQLGTSVAASPMVGCYSMVFVGSPGSDRGGHVDAGSVAYIGFDTRWHPAPLQATAAYEQGMGYIPGRRGTGHRWGASLAGLWNGDVVIGAPGDTVGTQRGAGSITYVDRMYYGNDPEHAILERITQDSPGVAGVAEAGDHFGASVAAAGAYLPASPSAHAARLVAVGAPGEDVGTAADAGMVHLFQASDVEVTPLAGLTQNSPGIGGSAERGDRFGEAVGLVGSGSSRAGFRLAVGAPGEDLGAHADSGYCQVLGLGTFAEQESFSPNSAGVPGTTATSGRFGSVLASAESTRESLLLIGTPYQGHGGVFARDYRSAVPTSRSWTPGAGGIPAGGATRFGSAVSGADGRP